MADSALPEPATHLEYKTTKDVVIGYKPSTVPHDNISGTALTDEQRANADQVVGSPAQGNGLTNSNLASVGGLGTDSGGTQTAPTVGEQETPRTATRKRGD